MSTYTEEQKKVLEYFTEVMNGDIRDEHIVITKDSDGRTDADIKSTRAAVKDRNNAAKMLAEIYDLVDSSMQVNVSNGDTQKLYDDLIAAKEALSNSKSDNTG